MWRRRVAITLVSQLPEDPDEGRQVLNLARELWDTWVNREEDKRGKVVALLDRRHSLAIPPPSKAVAKKPHPSWYKRFWKGILGTISGSTILFLISEAAVDASGPMIANTMQLQRQNLLPGESLQFVILSYRTENCPGTLYWEIVNRQGRLVAAGAQANRAHPVDVLEAHMGKVDVPILPVGLYTYRATATYRCANRPPSEFAVVPMIFWVIMP